jgi:hypothetical protein
VKDRKARHSTFLFAGDRSEQGEQVLSVGIKVNGMLRRRRRLDFFGWRNLRRGPDLALPGRRSRGRFVPLVEDTNAFQKEMLGVDVDARQQPLHGHGYVAGRFPPRAQLEDEIAVEPEDEVPDGGFDLVHHRRLHLFLAEKAHFH